jgi:hypothetical protein
VVPFPDEGSHIAARERVRGGRETFEHVGNANLSARVARLEIESMEGVPGRERPRANPTRMGPHPGVSGKVQGPTKDGAWVAVAGTESLRTRTAARQGTSEVSNRAVGLSQPKGAEGRWPPRG